MVSNRNRVSDHDPRAYCAICGEPMWFASETAGLPASHVRADHPEDHVPVSIQ